MILIFQCFQKEVLPGFCCLGFLSGNTTSKLKIIKHNTHLCSRSLLSSQLLCIVVNDSAKLSSSTSLRSTRRSGLSAPDSDLSGISTASSPARNVITGRFLDEELARARMSCGFTSGERGYALSSGILIEATINYSAIIIFWYLNKSSVCPFTITVRR